VAEGYEPKTKAPRSVLIRNATLLRATGETIARGSILLEDGAISAVSANDIEAPAGAEIIDGTGKFVTPGLIDTHSHLGVYPMPSVDAHEDGNEMVEPVTAQVQTVDAFWPQDPGIERAAAGGVTTMQVLPGSGNLVGGRAFTVKLAKAVSARAMHFEGAPDGLKMACGENPKRVYGKQKRAPMTRMGSLAMQRAAFLRAKSLMAQWSDWRAAEERRNAHDAKATADHAAKAAERASRESACAMGKESAAACDALRKQPAIEPLELEPHRPPPERDPGLETLAAAIEGRVLVHIHCYRADDMLAMVALSDEVGFRIRSFHHALEAYKIRDELARRSISVSTWADWWGFKMEAFDGIPENAALVDDVGGRAIIHSDSAEGIQRLNQEAAKAMASGRAAGIAVTDEDAIRWITANPAWALGVDERTGTLEVGKDADLVLWDRSPFSVYASAERVWIDGAETFRRGAPRWSDFELGAAPPPPLGPRFDVGGAR
jgi:imidazolonepropionase-like amidohydrolase